VNAFSFLLIHVFAQGSHQACCSIKELDVFNRASEIKVDPDKPLEGVRLAALQVTALLCPWEGEWGNSTVLGSTSWSTPLSFPAGVLPILSFTRLLITAYLCLFGK